jgi:IS30 family transposase
MRCYSHLSDDEREQIGLAKALGHSIGRIAHAIGRSKSTISRELCRNRLPSGRYSPLHAAGAYQLRRRREARIERDRALRTFVVDRLAEGWTPEQISGWLKGGNEPRLRAVGCETIYAFIYRAGQQAEQLWRYLTRHHKRRRPRRSRPRKIPSRIASPSTNGPMVCEAVRRITDVRLRSDEPKADQHQHAGQGGEQEAIGNVGRQVATD